MSLRIATLTSFAFTALGLLFFLRSEKVPIHQVRRLDEAPQDLSRGLWEHERPVIYTFFDEIDPDNFDENRSNLRKVDDELLKEWKAAWNDAGFEARIITLADAERHPRYNEFVEMLGETRMIGEGTPSERYNELCFIRWLAMAAVGGGFMADYDVFPIKDASEIVPHAPRSFTVYDGVPGYGGIPCMMSGSEEEWNRMSFTILEFAFNTAPTNEYDGWSDMYSLLELGHTKPGTYIMYDFISEVTELLSKPLDLNSCALVHPYIALHFSHGAIAKTGHHIQDRPKVAAETLQFLKENCFEELKDRPVIYTFFDEIDPDNEDANRAILRQVDASLLSNWKKAWFDAGWNPHIMTLADAQRHPKYSEFMKELEQVVMIGDGTTQARYNQICFIRWLAMASVGGGFMSDYDVFPIKHASALLPLVEGDFTVFDEVPTRGGIPSLMGGTEEGWLRMSFAILDYAFSHEPDPRFKGWSDFVALMELKVNQPESYYINDRVGEVNKLLSNPYNRQVCGEVAPFVALHFSHADIAKSNNELEKRPELAHNTIRFISEYCQEDEPSI